MPSSISFPTCLECTGHRPQSGQSLGHVILGDRPDLGLRQRHRCIDPVQRSRPALPGCLAVGSDHFRRRADRAGEQSDSGKLWWSHFIFASENGGIDAWSGRHHRGHKLTSASAVYKGLAIGTSSAGTPSFTPRTSTTTRSTCSTAALGLHRCRQLHRPEPAHRLCAVRHPEHRRQAVRDVCRAGRAPSTTTSQARATAIVDVFDTNGNFAQQIGHRMAPLNSPWGLALAQSNFGQFSGDLLVGNFGDGTINAFDPTPARSWGRSTMRPAIRSSSKVFGVCCSATAATAAQPMNCSSAPAFRGRRQHRGPWPVRRSHRTGTLHVGPARVRPGPVGGAPPPRLNCLEQNPEPAPRGAGSRSTLSPCLARRRRARLPPAPPASSSARAAGRVGVESDSPRVC